MHHCSPKKTLIEEKSLALRENFPISLDKSPPRVVWLQLITFLSSLRV